MDKLNDINGIGLIYENGLNMWAVADTQQKNQAHNNMPTSDIKNSYANANNTGNLPGNSAKMNSAGVPSFGENEEVVVKGYGKMTKRQVKVLINKTIENLHQMKQIGKFNQMAAKAELLLNLLKHV